MDKCRSCRHGYISGQGRELGDGQGRELGDGQGRELGDGKVG